MADIQRHELAKPKRIQDALQRVWQATLLFLEIIGLRDSQDISQEAQLARLRLYHSEFRKLIAANHSFLETLGDLEEKRLGYGYVDRSRVKRKTARALADVHAMIDSINVISDDRYASLRPAFDRISGALTAVMEDQPEYCSLAPVLELSEISVANTDFVGGKMANLAELANVLNLPTPDGMVVTTEGFHRVLEEGGIRSWIQGKHLEILSEQDIDPISKELQDRILGLAVPPALKEEILKAYDRLAEKAGMPVSMAVRSSAVGEDSEFSFAGQFLSLLNVPREELCSAYLKVIASLFSSEAMHYRFLHKIPGESAEMAVGFVTIVDAVSSGVVFSKNPSRPDSEQALVQAVKGLGVALVDGKTSPEEIFVSTGITPAEIMRTPSSQTTCMILAPRSGMKEEILTKGEAEEPCVTDDEVQQLAEWAVLLENHFGTPQDIEWAKDTDHRLIVLQSRPLRLTPLSESSTEPISGVPLILKGGEVGCPGVGYGPAVHMSG